MKERMGNICFRVFVCFYPSRCTMMNLGGKNRSMVIEPKFGPCDFFHKLGECTVEGSSR